MKRLACIVLLMFVAGIAGARELRVCADPNNLPFSNAQREGFENAIVEVIARDLGAKVEYVWWAQRRGALRNTLNAGKCDVVPGIASSMEMLATTRPYYRGTYMFVARRDSPWSRIGTFDDPELPSATIGVQLVGDDGANTPPAHSLARRGMVGNVRGFTVYGDYARPDPQAAIVDAVADGRVDIAVVWGPTAGYYAARHGDALHLAPVQPWLDGPLWPMTFDISLGVRRDDRELRRELDRALERNAAEIADILKRFHVRSVAPP